MAKRITKTVYSVRTEKSYKVKVSPAHLLSNSPCFRIDIYSNGIFKKKLHTDYMVYWSHSDIPFTRMEAVVKAVREYEEKMAVIEDANDGLDEEEIKTWSGVI